MNLLISIYASWLFSIPKFACASDAFLMSGTLFPSAPVNPAKLLHEACRTGDLTKVRQLIGSRVEVDWADEYGKTALMYAIGHGVKMIVPLVEAGAMVNHQDSQGFTALALAVHAQNYEATAYLLQQQASANLASNDGIAPLHRACYTGSFAIAQLLIQHDANVDYQGNRLSLTEMISSEWHRLTSMAFPTSPPYGTVLPSSIMSKVQVNVDVEPKLLEYAQDTPLIVASRLGRVDIVKLLLDAKAKVNLQNLKGHTALMWAAYTGHSKQIVQWLLEYNASVNLACNSMFTALHYTCHACSKAIVELLIRYGANVNCKSQSEHVPLHLFLLSRPLLKKESVDEDEWLDIALMLIQAGTNVNLIDKKSKTLLMYAIQIGCLPLVKALVESQAKINVQDSTKVTALIVAVNCNNYVVAKYLIVNNASINASDNWEQTPLHYACQLASVDMIKLLIQHGADANRVNRAGDSPFHILLKHCNVSSPSNYNYSGTTSAEWFELIKMLVKSGGNLNLLDIHGNSALMLAIEASRLDIVKYLVEAGAKLNQKDNNGNTLLSKAVVRGEAEIVEYLLQRGAAVDLTSKNGTTPLQQSCLNANINIINLLLKYKANVNCKDNNGLEACNYLSFGLVMSSYQDIGTALATIDKPDKWLLAVDSLVKNGANFESIDGAYDRNLLGAAVMCRRLDIVKLLIRHGANLKQPCMRNNTALTCAISHHYDEVAKFLILDGTSINTMDRDGNTPLQLCFTLLRVYLAKLLIKRNVNINYRNSIMCLIDSSDSVHSCVSSSIRILLTLCLKPKVFTTLCSESQSALRKWFQLPISFPINQSHGTGMANESMCSVHSLTYSQFAHKVIEKLGLFKKLLVKFQKSRQEPNLEFIIYLFKTARQYMEYRSTPDHPKPCCDEDLLIIFGILFDGRVYADLIVMVDGLLKFLESRHVGMEKDRAKVTSQLVEQYAHAIAD